MIRKMSVAGTFYPASEIEIEEYFEYFNKIYNDSATLPNVQSKAVIVPHAGYVYSGFTANIAYKILQNSKLKNFVVIGPSHRMAFNGVSLCQDQSYETPFDNIQSSDTLLLELKEKL